MMRSLIIILFQCCVVLTAGAQEVKSSLDIGDPAPPLRVREWIKGGPLQQLDKGQVYVLEFWATWCAPCRAAMPHLSNLAQQYSGKVIFVGMDVMEFKTTPFEKVKAFVDSMGNRMNYLVAAQESYLMESGWLNAAEVRGIPTTFIVDEQGRVAWIGYPHELNQVLPNILNKTWNIQEALAKRTLERRLVQLDDAAYYELIRFRHDPLQPQDLGKPDSVLWVINKMVEKEPMLKYTPTIVFQTFAALLKTDPQKAYEYGKAVLEKRPYGKPEPSQLTGAIQFYSDKLQLSPEIYQVGAEAYQSIIDQVPYPEITAMYKLYNSMAEWYWRANDQSKAVAAQQKAIEALKSKKEPSGASLAEYETRLTRYKAGS